MEAGTTLSLASRAVQERHTASVCGLGPQQAVGHSVHHRCSPFNPLVRHQMCILIAKNAFSLQSARDLGASVKEGNKWCQMCALTHCLTVEIRTSKSLAFWHCCVRVCAPCCLLHNAGQAFWLNFMHIPTSGKIFS